MHKSQILQTQNDYDKFHLENRQFRGSTGLTDHSAHLEDIVFEMAPFNVPSHAYEGSVEYPSALPSRSNIYSSYRIPSTTAMGRENCTGTTTSSEQRARVRELSLRAQSDACTRYTTASQTSGREAVGLQAHDPTSSQARRAQPYVATRRQPPDPPQPDLAMTPVRAAASARTSQEPAPRQTIRRPQNSGILSQADDLHIESIEHALASRVQPGSYVQQWCRSLFSLPPRYQDSSYRTDYLPSLVRAHLRYEFGPSLEDNMRALKDRLRPEYWAEVAVMLRAESLGTPEEGGVRRILINLHSLPPENEEVDPVPPYEERWEERYHERFGYARVPAYER